MRECKVWEQQDGVSLWHFRPSLVRLFPKDCRGSDFGILKRLQYCYRLIGGYGVYVLRGEDDAVGYAVLRRGPIFRYPFVSKGDCLLAPYWIREAQRRKGYAKQLLTGIKEDENGKFDRIWACILETNEASLKTVQAVGFSRIGWLDKSKTNKILTNNPTNCSVWRLERGNVNHNN